jgi:tetratricopeptide (TPR) repeat protein
MSEPTDLFVSYARRDNPDGRVAALVARIEDGFAAFSGRPLRVFFDTDAIAGMDEWQGRILKGLREARLFLACLSPAYIASEWCRREWEEYVRYEAIRQCLGEGIAPIYFVTLPGWDEPAQDQAVAAWIQQMRERQTFDLRAWNEEGERAVEHAHVAAALANLSGAVRERIARADAAARSPGNILRHNPAFVGRTHELRELRRAFARCLTGVVTGGSAPGAGAAAVQGLGGMGKTELALAYAHAFAWDYPGGRWQLACDGIADLRLALRQLAAALAFTFTDDENKDLDLAFARALHELGSRPRLLLLLDNVSEPALLEPNRFDRLPRGEKLDILVTTRLPVTDLPGTATEFRFLAVDELPKDDALALMRSHQREGRFLSAAEENASREIVALLGGFTLAVETAAIYLGRHAAADGCAAFRDRLRADLLTTSEDAAGDRTVAVRHYERLLRPTLQYTFEALGEEARHVLLIAALLPADQIALPWLRAVGEERFPGFDAETWGCILGELRGLRLFMPGADTQVARMHRMVQAETRRRGAKQAIDALDTSLQRHAVSRGDHLMDAWVNAGNRWELQPLVATALQWLAARVPAGHELASSAAIPLVELALYPEAEAICQKALQFAKSECGWESDETVTSANNLAGVYRQTNRLADAATLLRGILEIEERRHGQSHPAIAASANNLGSTLHALGNFAEAEKLLRRALAVLASATTPDAHLLASVCGNLAHVFEDTNRGRDAEPLYRRALEIAEKEFGPEHHLVSKTLTNLASSLQSTARLDEAEQVMRRAIATGEKTFGLEHPAMALKLNNLAELLREANRYAEAEPLYRQALAITERFLGPHHPEVSRVLNNLAIVLTHTGRVDDAEATYRRAVEILEVSYGPVHQEIPATLGNLARTLHSLGKYAEAEELFRRSIQIDERLFGPEHAGLAPNLANLADLLFDLKLLDEAESLSRRHLIIVARGSQQRGQQHTFLPIAASKYLQLLKRMGLPDATARMRVEQVVRAFGFSVFPPD